MERTPKNARFSGFFFIKEKRMAKAKVRGLSSIALMQLALGVFFVVLGIAGILPQAGEGIFGLSKDRTTLEIIFGVFEILCGVFFLIDSVKRLPRKTSILFILVILGLWVVRIIISEFIQGIDLKSDSIVFRPTFWSWLLNLSIDLVVTSCLWFLYKSE